MNNDPKEIGREFAAFLKSLPLERLKEINQRQLENANNEYAEFRAAFQLKLCYLCRADLSSFYRVMPCLHWMLKPAGFNKSDFLTVADTFGYRSLSCYLRWIANEDGKARGINDLREEATGKFIEETIRYRQFEWAFSCGESDYQGHDTRNVSSQRPHYHFQMRVNRQSFIKYNEFHVPFTEQDLIDIEAMRAAPEFIKRVNVGSEGMNDLLHGIPSELLISHGLAVDDESNAPLSLSTMIIAAEGETLASIGEIIEEAKRTGVTVASLAHKRLPTAKIHTVISPGEGVVEHATRSGRGRGPRSR